MILDAILGPAIHLSGDVFDDSWYDGRYDGFRGVQTSSGVRVDEYSAFNYSVCWAATRLLAGTSGWLPFNLHKRKAGGGAEIDGKHRVHRIIHDQPNRDMGSMMFRARGFNHQINWGNTFAEIVRNAGGMVESLEPIHPRRIPARNIVRENGRIVYYVYRPDGIGKPQRIEQEDMFHVASIISEDGIVGRGVITAARESIGKAMATQTRGAAALKNGGAPPLALKGGKFKNKEERKEYRREINEVHGGPENAGKWLLLPPESEAQLLGFSLQDSQFIESEQFDIEEISRWYGVPPHLVGHLLRATFNNIEELGISFVKYSLIQWLKLWEQEVWRKLLTPAEQETHYAKFNVDALERGNMATRTEAGVKKFFNGLWTLNDWASQEDMNPIDETATVDGKKVSLGDMHFVQQAMIPLALAAKGPPEPATPQVPEIKQQEEPPKPDEPLQAVRSDVAALATNSTALALSVERIAGVLGELQVGQRQLTEATQSGLQSLRVTVETNHAAALDSVQALAVTVEATAAAQEVLAERLDKAASADAVQSALSRIESTLEIGSTAQGKLAAAMLRDVFSRLLSVEVNGVKRVAEKASKFDVRLREFYDKHTANLERAIAEPLALLNGHAPKDLAAKHVAESLRQLDLLCDCTADELAGRVDECVSKWHEERATVTL